MSQHSLMDDPVLQVQLAPPSPGAPRTTSPRSTRRSKKTVRRAKPSVAASSPKPKYQEKYQWFWKAVSPKWTTGQGSRLAQAEASLSVLPSGITGPSVSSRDIAKILNTYETEIQEAAADKGLSPVLIASVIWIESRGNPNAVSHAGAGGLMQLMPATAKRMGVTDRFDPAQNIAGGAAYLKMLLQMFDDDILLALAGYNAGENAVIKNGGVPPYAETRDYVPKVLAGWIAGKTLCDTTPQSVRQGCIWDGV